MGGQRSVLSYRKKRINKVPHIASPEKLSKSFTRVLSCAAGAANLLCTSRGKICSSARKSERQLKS